MFDFNFKIINSKYTPSDWWVYLDLGDRISAIGNGLTVWEALSNCIKDIKFSLVLKNNMMIVISKLKNEPISGSIEN